MITHNALIALEDGSLYPGTGFGAEGATVGEVVFSTSMTGYQETLTDPSYHRQIIVSTVTQMGSGLCRPRAESAGEQLARNSHAQRLFARARRDRHQ